MKAQFNLPLFIVLFLSCSCKPAPETSYAYDDTQSYFEVKKVVDGDTFWVDDGSAKGMKIRLIGIDAPESRKSFKKQVGYLWKRIQGLPHKPVKGEKSKTGI